MRPMTDRPDPLRSPALLVALLMALGLPAGGAAGASPSPAPPPFPPAETDFPAPRILLSDDMEAEGPWPDLANEAYRMGRVDGALRIELLRPSQAAWGWVNLDGMRSILRGSMTVRLDGEQAAAGLLCGTSAAAANGSFLGGGFATDGTWFVGRVTGSGMMVIARGPLARPPADGSAELGLACGQAQGGGDRIRLAIDGATVAELLLAGIGPFDRLGIYAARGIPEGGARFDDARILGGDLIVARPPGPAPDPTAVGTPAPPTPVPTPTPAPSPNAAEIELWAHLPSDFAASCERIATDATEDVLAGALCRPAGSLGIAEYYLYRDVAAMTAAFEASVPDGLKKGRCGTGPARGAYTLGGKPAGRMACYVNPGSAGGVIVAWTTEPLRILGYGVREDGDFGALQAWWVEESGPF